MTVRDRRGRAVRSAALIGAVLVVALSGASCSDDGAATVPRDEFETRLAEREGITADQASCVSQYVYDGYADDAIAQLHEGELQDLPSPLWSEYAHAMVACVLGDQLGVQPPAEGEAT